jgi:hypothetical protein
MVLTNKKKARMKEINYYEKAKEYLLSFDEITPEILDEYTLEDAWRNRKPDNINKLFKSLLHHAKNRQQMPNSIGEIEELSTILFEFNYQEIINKYSDWEEVFDAIIESDYTPPGIMDKTNRRNLWVSYCKSIMSISKFISKYKDLKDFQKFIDGFLTNEYSKLALPLLLQAELHGFGFALSCDFIKESVSPQFVKPDVYINWFALKLGITQSENDYQIFKDMEQYCSEIDELPYAVDKIFWLVGSGNFHLHNITINCSKEKFITSIE